MIKPRPWRSVLATLSQYLEPYRSKVMRSPISASDIARDLGVLLDCQFNMTNHIKQVYHTITWRTSSALGLDWPQNVTETLVHALNTTRLDYCSGLIYGLSRQTVSQLERVQNLADWLITQTRKFDHISLVLRQPHWLSVSQRIIFQIVMLTFRALMT